ncbi:MAG: LacI family DNA-binding transcriptional regulator [Schleiferilactobacillus perolens]|uniref:LacI family DNA-binding transcriptional regulator n=1 Tax=Schleiferilactobacillus perolens TaxID=100468 RepID=UPI0039E8F021
MAGIRDVAKEAKVSATTTSRFLNSDPDLMITDETKRRILAAVEKLHYVKRSNKSRKNTRIGLLVTKTERDEYDDPYFRDIRLGILDGLKAHSLDIGVTYHIGDKIDAMMLQGLDAFVIVGTLEHAWLDKIYAANQNVVLVDDYYGPANIDAVYPDFQQSTTDVLERLAKQGHQRISFIGGAAMSWRESGKIVWHPEGDLRLRTYQQWMDDHDLGQYSHSFIGGWDYMDGAEQTRNLLQHFHDRTDFPTALVVASDPLAIGVYRELHTAHIRMPEDLAVISFDNSAVADYLTPSLTSVKLRPYEMGKSAVRMAAERIQGTRDYPLRVLLPTEIIGRESDDYSRKAEEKTS